jgi:hypothetical protein
MQALRDQIVDQQHAAAVRVIKPRTPSASSILTYPGASGRALTQSNRKRFLSLGGAVKTVNTQ